MALTIRNITDEQIEQAKTETGCGTASAALVDLIDLAVSRRRLIDKQIQKVKQLEERLERLERVQARLASAADEALTLIRQREFL